MKKSKTLIGLSAMALLLISCQGNQAPKAVDMGLSVKWATCNIGANTPEGLGDYYAWGEVITKPVYNSSTYSLYNEERDYYTRYCYDSHYGVVDNKLELEIKDDVATRRLGRKWHMPTSEEWAELLDTNNCVWTWTSQNETEGYRVSSKINGNSIFLPATGYRKDGDLKEVGETGQYWSSSIDQWWPEEGRCVEFGPDRAYQTSEERYKGLSVRPVKSVGAKQTNTVILANAELQQWVIQAFYHIPDQRKVGSEARAYMTKDLYDALAVAWDVPRWCVKIGGFGNEEFLFYFIAGDNWGEEESRIEIITTQKRNKEYYVDLVHHGARGYCSRVHSLVIVQENDGLLLDDFDGNKQWCKKYIKEEVSNYISGKTINKLRRYECDEGDVSEVKRMFETFISTNKKYIDSIMGTPKDAPQ